MSDNEDRTPTLHSLLSELRADVERHFSHCGDPGIDTSDDQGYIVDGMEALGAMAMRLTAASSAARDDAKRLDWLEREVKRLEVVRLEFTEAGSEAGDYGSVLSSWPRGFWINDGDGRDHSTLRQAIDAARTQPEGSNG